MVPPALGPPTLDDATLAIRAAGGDAMAQAAIWGRHATLVRRILVRALGSSVDLEDLVQEVFLALHCNRSRLREPNALRSYIYGIALRVAGTELRARRMRACFCLTPDGTIDRFEAPRADPDAWRAVRRLQDI